LLELRLARILLGSHDPLHARSTNKRTYGYPEFIDAYSDDLIYLQEGRTALLTHPLMPVWKENLDASFSRMLAIFMIGNIEVMLETWRDRDRVKVLDVYFAKKGGNGERVRSLYDAFVSVGIQVEREVFDDYLAIKYLRNTIVHTKWKEHEREWLESRGFPGDTRKLTKQHLDRLWHVNQSMMFYIFLTCHAEATANKPTKLLKLEETVAKRPDETGILRWRDIDRIIWNNLDRINDQIDADIKKAATSERYDWTEGRSLADLERLAGSEAKRLFYLAAMRAGEEKYELLARHRGLAKEALAFWREYWQRAVESRGLLGRVIEHSLEVFESPQFEKLYTRGATRLLSAVENMPDDAACRLVEATVKDTGPFTNEEILSAFRAGHLASELIPNIMPLTLLTLGLPIVDPENAGEYLSEADRALQAFKLNRAWYSWVEHGNAPRDEGLQFYSRMRQEFAAR
jgi:hypothetical protein